MRCLEDGIQWAAHGREARPGQPSSSSRAAVACPAMMRWSLEGGMKVARRWVGTQLSGSMGGPGLRSAAPAAFRLSGLGHDKRGVPPAFQVGDQLGESLLHAEVVRIGVIGSTAL